jgi:hypothetical protein
MSLPEFEPSGDLPAGIHRATLGEVVSRFGKGSWQRVVVGERLDRIYHMARLAGHLLRFVVFGSFVTDEPSPNDVDVFLVMDDAFEVELVGGDARLLFDHAAADAHLGASVFWVRRLAAFGGEESAVQFWQAKRGGGTRGIVEIVEE